MEFIIGLIITSIFFYFTNELGNRIRIGNSYKQQSESFIGKLVHTTTNKIVEYLEEDKPLIFWSFIIITSTLFLLGVVQIFLIVENGIREFGRLFETKVWWLQILMIFGLVIFFQVFKYWIQNKSKST